MAWDFRTVQDTWAAAHDAKWAINDVDDYTIACFIDVTDSSTDRFLARHRDDALGSGWEFRINPTNTLRMIVKDGANAFYPTSNITHDDNTLHMIAVRVKNSTLDLDYFIDDGAADNFTMPATIDADSVNPLTLGGMQGIMYWFAMWATGLSDNQIKGLYAGGVPVLRLPIATNSSDLVVYHECNDLPGGTTGGWQIPIQDLSQYQTTFTASGSPDFVAGPYATLGAGPISVLAPAAAPPAGNPWYYYAQQEAVA